MGFLDIVGDAFDAVGDAVGTGLGTTLDLGKAFYYAQSGPEDMMASADLTPQGARKFYAAKALHDEDRGATARQAFFADHAKLHGAIKVATANSIAPFAAAMEDTSTKAHRTATTWEILNSGELGGMGGVYGSVASVFNGRASKAWDKAQGVSFGQAVTRDAASATDVLLGDEPYSGAASSALGIKGSTLDNIHDFGERGNKRFSPAFSGATGSIDGLFDWYANPFVVAGKGAKVAQLSHSQLRPGDVEAIASTDTLGLTGRQKRIKRETDKFITGTDGYSASELMAFKSFKHPQGAALASLFAQAESHEQKRLVLLTSMANPAAKRALTEQRADLGFQLDRAQSELDDLVFSRTIGAKGLFGDEYLAELTAEVKSSERHMDLYNRALGDDAALEASARLRTQPNQDAVGLYGSVNNRVRLSKIDKMRAHRSSSYTIQNGVLGIPVRVLQAPFQRRASGRVDFHDADQGLKEMDDMTRHVRATPDGDWTPELRKDMLDGYANAVDDNARRLQKTHIETKVFNHIARTFGYHPADAEALLSHTMAKRGKLSTYNSRAYSAAEREDGTTVDLIVLEDGTTMRRPLMETQLANSEPTLDVAQVYRVLGRNAHRYKAVRAGSKAFDVIEDFGDVVNDLWKTSSLMRLGFVERNIMDSQLRLLAHLGGLDWMRVQAGNAGHRLSHAIDETRPTAGQGGFNAGGPHNSFPDAMGITADEVRLNKTRMSAKDTYANLAMGEADRLLNEFRGTGSWITKHGTDEGYTDDYVRLLNNHVRQSEITQRLLAGEHPDRIIDHLHSSEGRALRRRMVHGQDSPEDLVASNVQNLNHLVPSQEYRAILNERPFTAEDVEAMFGHSNLAKPPINAEQVAFSLGSGPTAKAYRDIKEKYFALANGLPDDVLGRHPLFTSLYRGQARVLLNRADPGLTGIITTAEQRTLEEQARLFARKEMKGIMFDIANKSDLGHFVRFIMPFFSAWEDVMVKYGRMIVKDPSLLPHAWMLWTAPNDASFVEVVDAQTGKPVKSRDSTVSDHENIVLPAPWLERYFSLGEMQLSKASFNIVLQGNPLWSPGYGPWAQAPTNSIALAMDSPDFASAVQALGILPFGTEDAGPWSARKFLPSTIKNITLPEDRKARLAVMVLQTEMYRFHQGKRDKAPTPGEIKDRVNNLVHLRTFTSFTSPVSVQYKSPYQFYIDQSHAYDQKYGPQEGDRKFLKDFGEDAYVFRTSMSNNRTGIQATKQADRTARKLKDLISEHPDFGWFFVGPDNVGEYDRNVYTAQTVRKLNPLSSQTYRDVYADPRDAFAKNNAELGWTEYQRLTTRLEAIRIQRGLRSMDVKGASDLRAAKARYLETVTNPDTAPAWGHDWLNDYDNRDFGKVRKFLEAAKAATLDKRTSARPDVVVMAEYLRARGLIRKRLLQRGNAPGGSHTLAGNDDIAAVWGQITGLLVDQNVTFSDIYARYLERDDLARAV